MGDAPLADGWYAVGFSADFPPGGVDPVEHFGRELVAWRGEDGEMRLLDAHCRHLGAHLGYGGKVEGGAIRCPFHAWRWRGDGVCDEIPYASKIPPGARLRSWPVREVHGLILAWWGAVGGTPGAAPHIDEPPAMPPEPRTRRWMDVTEVGRASPPVEATITISLDDGGVAEIAHRPVGPGLFVDEILTPGRAVVIGGWTPVDERRGHLRAVAFADTGSSRLVEEIWARHYGADARG